MPRAHRISFPGAWYHIMNRGGAKRYIFLVDEHRHYFLYLLERVSELFSCEIHAFCLMGNHYHILVHTPKANISLIIHYLNGLYAKYFNKLRHRDGPLFRGRYCSRLVDHNNYLLQVSRYIHLNPIGPGLAEQPEEYLWSSFTDYIGEEKRYKWLKTDVILGMMTSRFPKQEYTLFVDEGLDKYTHDFFNKTHPPRIFGSETEIMKHIAAISPDSITPTDLAKK